MVQMFRGMMLVMVRCLGGVVRKNKVRLCWGRDHVKSIVWGSRVVVLLLMFLRQKGSS